MTDTHPSCDYCGLPVPRSWWSRQAAVAADTKQYCCFGCRFAAAVTQSRGEHGAANWTLTRLGVAIFLSMNVMVFTMALWTQDFYGTTAGTEDFTGVLRDLFRYLCLLFSLPVLLLLGGPLLDNAWTSCRRGILSADVLLILGVAAAYVYSAISVFRDDGPVYFEVGCAVLVLVTLGRWLEATGKLRTTEALASLHRLLPDQARLVDGDHEQLVPCATISVGQRVRVLPGERIPCDGIVERNSASVDAQALTGESLPAVKEPGDNVFGGSLNLDGDLYIRVTAAAGAGTLARLIELVRQARNAKGHYERLADRVTAWFLPLVVLISVGALVVHARSAGIDKGVLASLAVLLIACPCALGLATPMAVWNALGQAARRQVLFRNGAALEQLASVRAMCFDKTGTLTTGQPVVARYMVAEGENEGAVLSAAAAIAASSTHSYANVIRELARLEGLLDADGAKASAARTLPGRGISGWAGDRQIYLGSARFMAESGLHMDTAIADAVEQALHTGQSLTCVGWQDKVRGVFVLRESLRSEAAAALAELRTLGIHVEILTGDSRTRADLLERELGLNVQAELLPEDKVAALTDIRRRHGPVAMVGDGINDAPALAASDVGIALGCGTDVARESAPVCLFGNDLLHLPWTIRLARRTVRVIRQNLLWAFIYNVAGIGLACTGRLNPVFAALAMVLSSFFVVTNSLRLSLRELRPAATDPSPNLPIHATFAVREPVP